MPDRPGEIGWAARWLYDAYGNRKLISAGGSSGGGTASGSLPSSAHASSVGYRSQLHDSATGDIFLRNRFYSPSLGRFTSPDPIGYSGGFNLYSYADGEPVNSWDPMGLQRWHHLFPQALFRELGFGNMIDSPEWGVLFDEHTYNRCLLYTSPSPRDS